jgi:hypothetical protein
MKEKTFTAWAIQLDKEHGLAGRYWWFRDLPSNIPPHMEGCKSALFTTRKIARENLKYVRSPIWPKARVVKVTVKLEWEL